MTAIPLLEVTDLHTIFPVRAGLWRRVVDQVYAVDGVSLRIEEGETVGVVGESGSGKTTLGRSLLRLVEPTRGSVRFRGEEVLDASTRRLRALRAEMQIVFQDPYASLHPRMPVIDVVAEPMRIHGRSRSAARSRAAELLEAVGLRAGDGRRHPHEFSGGQRQRIAIARALALRPSLIVLDEPVSALDVVVRAEVITVLADLQAEFGLAYLFIAHDLSLVHDIADRVAVLYLGTVVESADRADLFGAPAHPYTQSLLSAVPIPNPRRERARTRIVLTGEVPSPIRPPSGCRFHPRCPIAGERCGTERPALRQVSPGHAVACHFPLAPGESLSEGMGR